MKWIKSEDRLPAIEGPLYWSYEVLGYHKDWGMRTVFYDHENNQWCDSADTDPIETSHWMELPQKPKD